MTFSIELLVTAIAVLICGVTAQAGVSEKIPLGE